MTAITETKISKADQGLFVVAMLVGIVFGGMLAAGAEDAMSRLFGGMVAGACIVMAGADIRNALRQRLANREQ
ncbi:hypothetical protein ABN028_19890 [Actinopolymorpha sp. B17G11]|uniref:hypothetical protein n=1 Tax=Actinopolymorpha sp. B17G11 TaxID=3160861 RepID=UPI0032E41ACD